MTEKILRLLAENGTEALIIGLAVNVLTGALKIPMKAWAKRLKDGTRLTRFIVFLPIVLGGILSALYWKGILKSPAWGKEFFTLWISSSSLSLTFYAIFEKLFPSKKKPLSEAEVQANEALLEKLRQWAEREFPSDEETAEEENAEVKAEASADGKEENSDTENDAEKLG